MVSFELLIQFVIMITNVISLVYTVAYNSGRKDKKNNRPSSKK